MKKMGVKMLVVAASAVWAMVGAPLGALATECADVRMCESEGIYGGLDVGVSFGKAISKADRDKAPVSGAQFAGVEGGEVDLRTKSPEAGTIEVRRGAVTGSACASGQGAITGGKLEVNRASGDLSAHRLSHEMVVSDGSAPSLAGGGTLAIGSRATLGAIEAGTLRLDETCGRATGSGDVVAGSGRVIAVGGAIESGSGVVSDGVGRGGAIQELGGAVAPGITACGGMRPSTGEVRGRGDVVANEVVARGVVAGTSRAEPATPSKAEAEAHVVGVGSVIVVCGVDGGDNRQGVGDSPTDGEVPVDAAVRGDVEWEGISSWSI